MAKTSSAVKNKWMQENYDRVNIMVKKGEKDILKAAAAARGDSVSRYVIDMINRGEGRALLTVLDDDSKRKKAASDQAED